MESDGTVEVLKEIRDEIRNVRTELGEQLRNARAGVRTERVERASRWRLAATAATGAVALLALVVAVRAGGSAATAVAPSAVVATAAPAAPAAAPTPAASSAPVAPAVAAGKPAPTKPAPKLAATAPAAQATSAAPRKRVNPAATTKPAVAMPAEGDDETIAFSPPQPLDRLAAGHVALDDLRDVGGGDADVPDRLRVDDDGRSLEARAEAPGRGDRHPSPELGMAPQPLLQRGDDIARPARAAGGLPPDGPRVLADEEVALDFGHVRQCAILSHPRCPGKAHESRSPR
jgi:hypothetical protein